jgi:hypothetical protein
MSAEKMPSRKERHPPGIGGYRVKYPRRLVTQLMDTDGIPSIVRQLGLMSSGVVELEVPRHAVPFCKPALAIDFRASGL